MPTAERILEILEKTENSILLFGKLADDTFLPSAERYFEKAKVMVHNFPGLTASPFVTIPLRTPTGKPVGSIRLSPDMVNHLSSELLKAQDELNELLDPSKQKYKGATHKGLTEKEIDAAITKFKAELENPTMQKYLGDEPNAK